MASSRGYPSVKELHEWLSAARAQVVAIGTHTAQERVDFRTQLRTRLVEYEAWLEWVMSNPETVYVYLERPSLAPGPEDRPWREQFFHADAALYVFGVHALAFHLVRDVLNFLRGMTALGLLHLNQCTSARDVLAHLYGRTIPEPREHRIYSLKRDDEGWQPQVLAMYKREHAVIKAIWQRHKSSNKDRIEKLQQAYPAIPVDEWPGLVYAKPHEAAKAVVAHMCDRSSHTIHQVIALARRVKKNNSPS